MMVSCQEEVITPNQPVVVNVGSTLELTRSAADPFSNMRNTQIDYVDITGQFRSEFFQDLTEDVPVVNVDSVDFNQQVSITSTNSAGGMTFDANWYLKKDGVMIDSDFGPYYTYMN